MGYKKYENCHITLYDRIKNLLVSSEWSDCCFSVSGKHFKAHTLILGTSSPVFKAMFYGPLSTADEVSVTDIEPDVFQLLLNYIYTDNVEMSSIEEAFELLYASRKYILESLTELCISYIKENISIDNVATILSYPDFMQDKELISCSLKLVCEHAHYILQQDKNITSTCMKTVLESNQMNIMEKDLIKLVFNWTARYCQQNNVPKVFENRRDVLIKNGIFKLLRFFTLSIEELDEVTNDVNSVLLQCEVEYIKKIIKDSRPINNMDEFDTLSPIITPRGSLKLHQYLCHRSPLRSVAPIIIDSNNYQISSRVKANKSVFITSLSIPTRMAPMLNFSNFTGKVYSEQISISVVCESDKSIVKITNFMNTVDYDSVVEIELSEPCFINKDEWYQINFVWPRNRFLTYSYAVEFRDRISKVHKVTFEFEESFSMSGSGSFLCGLKFCL